MPLESTLLPTAESSLVIATGHDVYRHDDAVAEVLRVLHLERAAAEAAAARGEAGAAPTESE